MFQQPRAKEAYLKHEENGSLILPVYTVTECHRWGNAHMDVVARR